MICRETTNHYKKKNSKEEILWFEIQILISILISIEISSKMSLKLVLISCLLLSYSSAEESDVKLKPTERKNWLIKGSFNKLLVWKALRETVYDINLYITIPSSVVAIGLLLCLCYCLLYACRNPEGQGGTHAIQPVFVTNRNSPVVVSSQSSSVSKPKANIQASLAPNTPQVRTNPQTQQQSPRMLDRFWGRTNTGQQTDSKAQGNQTNALNTATNGSVGSKPNLAPTLPSTSTSGQMKGSPIKGQALLQSSNTSPSAANPLAKTESKAMTYKQEMASNQKSLSPETPKPSDAVNKWNDSWKSNL